MSHLKGFTRWTKIFVLLITAGFIFTPAFAAEYPSRPVSIIVPYNAGGGVDINTRALAPHLEKHLGKTIIVQNRGGGGGVTGHTLGASAKPDGYTLTMVSTSISAAPWLVKNVRYKPEDYAYIGQVSFVPNFLFVNAKSQWKTLKELIDYAKKNPGKLTVPSMDGWPSTNIANAVFASLADIKVKIIPGYKGGAPELASVLGGHNDYAFCNTNELLPHVPAGTLRILAAAAQKRSPFIPDIPTFPELGYDVTVGVYRALAAPSKTPKPILEKLDKALRAALAEPALAKDFKKVGLTIDYLDPEETRTYVLSQYEQFGKIFRNLGIAIK